jgi:predicted nuclease of predicted toxin-antitoxin system
MLRFKIDENLPAELVAMLTAAGHDTLSIYAQKLEGEPDDVISKVCKAEKRAIITLDIGFANVHEYPPEQYSGIVVVRVKSQDKINVLNTFHKALPLLESEPLIGKMWVVDETKVRIRG